MIQRFTFPGLAPATPRSFLARGGSEGFPFMRISRTTVPVGETGAVAQLTTNLTTPIFSEFTDVANISVAAGGVVSFATSLADGVERLLNAQVSGSFLGFATTIQVVYPMTGVAAAAALADLTLGTATLTSAMAPGSVVASISGKTAGSTVTMTGAAFDNGRLAVSGAGTSVVVGAAGPLAAGQATGTYSLVETLAGASNTPRTSGPFASITAAEGSTFVLTDALYDGDSRTASAGSYLSGFTLSSGMATPGFAGLIQALVGNKFHLTNGFQHGIGASTTLAMNGRRTTASQALTGNPAFATIPTAADNQLNSNSDGKYALADNPGKLVISASMGVNDNNIFFNDPAPAYGTIRQIAQYADALGAAGFKLYMGNEVAKGRSTYLMERRTVGVAGGFAADTCRVINTGNFLDGESYGAVGVVGQFTAGAPRPLTKVASAPGQDQYTVTSAGVFTFGGTAPITAFITYNANGTSGGSTEDGLRVIRNWCASSAPNFIAADSGAATGFNYAIPGLLFNRPHVRVADTFNALLDLGSGAEQRALPGTFDQLQLHGYATGQWLAANAFKTLFDTDFPTAPRLDFQPTRNNWWAARANNATTVFSGTLPPTMRVVTPTLVSINGTPIGRADTSTGVITGTGITSGSLNFATGDWTITFANAAAAGPLNSQIWFEQDIGNFDTATLTIGTISRNPVMNGLLDMTPAVGTNLSTTTGVSIVTLISGSQLPYGWSLQAGAGNAALNAAIAASTATVTVNVTVDGNGYNQLNLSVEGVHSAVVSPTITSTINTPANRVRTTGGLFVGARLVYAPHPVIGRMYGTTGYTLSFTGSTSAVTRDTFEGRTTTVATVGARVTDVGLNIFMDDKFLATANGGTPGPFSLYRISGLLDLDGPSGSPAINWTTASLSFSCTTAINVPFAVRIGIGRVQCRAAPNSAAFAAAAAA